MPARSPAPLPVTRTPSRSRSQSRSRRHQSPVAVAVAGVVALLASCGGGPTASPQELLDTAGQTLRDADTVHVLLEGAGLPGGSGAQLLGGEGDAVRPDGFTGALRVRLLGQSADVGVLSSGGTLYAQLPFTSGLTQVDPAEVGIPDPGRLVARDGGVDQLVSGVQEPTAGEATRAGGEVRDVVTGTLPGQLVADVLLLADPSDTVDVSLQVVRDSGELRLVTLTGPFYEAGTDSTYTVRLEDYDAPVTLPAPPA